jgi:hypothetical protein
MHSLQAGVSQVTQKKSMGLASWPASGHFGGLMSIISILNSSENNNKLKSTQVYQNFITIVTGA